MYHLHGYKAWFCLLNAKQSSVFLPGLYQFQLMNAPGMTDQPSGEWGRSISRHSQCNLQVGRYADASGSHFSSLKGIPSLEMVQLELSLCPSVHKQVWLQPHINSFITPLSRITWEFFSFSAIIEIGDIHDLSGFSCWAIRVVAFCQSCITDLGFLTQWGKSIWRWEMRTSFANTCTRSCTSPFRPNTDASNGGHPFHLRTGIAHWGTLTVF